MSIHHQHSLFSCLDLPHQPGTLHQISNNPPSFPNLSQTEESEVAFTELDFFPTSQVCSNGEGASL